jgi:hypothetical protein
MSSILPSTGLFGSLANVYAQKASGPTLSFKPFLMNIASRWNGDSVSISPRANLLNDTRIASTRLQLMVQAITDTSGPITSLQQLTAPGIDLYIEVPEDNVVIMGTDATVNQKYDTRDFARLNSGSGNDQISMLFAGEAFSGDGDDVVTGLDASLVSAGAGNDTVTVGHDSTVYGENGNDIITAGDRSQIDAGSGNNVITAGDRSNIVADGGNDIITVGALSNVDAGAGNDTIVAGENSLFVFGAGDGNDTITAAGKSTIQFGAGLSATSMRMEVSGDDMLISFDNSPETITFKNYQGKSPSLVFADGATYSMAFG